MGRKVNFIVLAFLAIVSLVLSGEYYYLEGAAEIDSGDTAWMIVASAFVLLMTPGLAFFYGGMVRKKSVTSTMLQSFVALGPEPTWADSMHRLHTRGFKSSYTILIHRK